MLKSQKIREADVIRAVSAYVKRCRLCLWRQNTGSMSREYNGKTSYVKFGLKGAADFTGILPDGRRIEVECKRPGGRQSPDQRAFQLMIERNGGVYLLVESLDEFVRKITEL